MKIKPAKNWVMNWGEGERSTVRVVHPRPARARPAPIAAAATAPAAAPDEIAALFDPVKVATLEKMFPPMRPGQWAGWAEHAKRYPGLLVARVGRAKFNPYLAGKWFLAHGAPGWTEARLLRVLGNNLPARSADKRELFGLVADE